MSVLVPLSPESLGAIELESENGVLALRLTGDIDHAAVDWYERRSAEEPPVIGAVDLSGVSYLSSTGVGFLIRATQSARDVGARPLLRGLGGPAARILSLTGAVALFEPLP
jgi:anti-sigma B factor antagonist